MENNKETIIRRAYALFNERNTDDLLQLMLPDVEWPNGWEGGYVYGQDAVREYWSRQWKEIDPNVQPESFEPLPDGRVRVAVRQLVKDLQGEVMSDGIVYHTYTFAGDKVSRMVITSGEAE